MWRIVVLGGVGEGWLGRGECRQGWKGVREMKQRMVLGSEKNVWYFVVVIYVRPICCFRPRGVMFALLLWEYCPIPDRYLEPYCHCRCPFLVCRRG